MEEYLDVVDENNKPTGEKRSRKEVHSTGLWHRTVHIYLFRIRDGVLQFLIQLRSKSKDLHPNCWDPLFGGHVQSSEEVKDTVEKELREEIGLTLSPGLLIEGAVHRSDIFPNREFNSVYYYHLKEDIASLKFNDGEVQTVRWMDPDTIMKEMKAEPKQWTSGPDRLQAVVAELKGKLKNID